MPADVVPSPQAITAVGSVVVATGFVSVNEARTTFVPTGIPGVTWNVVPVATIVGAATIAVLFATAD
jgi:hypothetical protein